MNLKLSTKRIQLIHPNSLQLIPVYLEIAGVNSKPFVKARKKFYRDYLAANQDQLKLDSPIPEIDEDALSEQLIAASIVGYQDDEKLVFQDAYSKEAVEAVVKDPGYYWIVVQVESHLQANQGFLEE